jgi:hypothetical protein
MIKGPMMTLTALRPEIAQMAVNSIDNAVEFAIVFASGHIFYTGGFESIETLENAMRNAEDITGSYSLKAVPWCQTQISQRQIESIIDLRTDTQD